MRLSKIVVFTSCLLLAGAAAAQEVGRVVRLQGEAMLERGGTSRSLALDAAIAENDLVKTGVAARVQLRFTDNMELTLGERSLVRIERFLFDPEARSGQAGLRFDGTFRVVSGLVGKLAPNKVRLTTPVANLGLRGTDLWAGPLDGALDVTVLEGSVAVFNEAGEVVLRAGEGTVIPAPGAAPGAPKVWGKKKLERAIARVAFE